MMPNSVRFGVLDLDYDLQASSNEFPYYQMGPTLHIDPDLDTSLLLPSDNIWNKFDIPFQTSKSSKIATFCDEYDDDSEFDPLRGDYATPSSTGSCEIRHHDCMWAGRCSSKDHKQFVAEAAAAAAARPTARKPIRAVNNHRHEMKVITLKPQTVAKASAAADNSMIGNSKKCVIGLSNNSASLLKAPVKTTSSRSLLRTPLNIVTPNFSKDTSFSLDSDGDSPRPDTPQTSESEDDGDDVLFKHHLDISSSVSAVCNDDSDDILGYAGYRTHSTTSYSCGVEVEEGEEEEEDDDEEDEATSGKALGGKLLDMYSSIYTMRQDLDRIRKPVGTRENPVRSCKDLYYGHPQFKDGWYWIDPNLGMIDDSVYVFCNMTGRGETCVFPDIHSSQMPNIPWMKEGNKNGWYSNLRGGFRITYETIGVVQMTFLRLLSEDAYQNFTYTCINSAAWYNAKTFGHEMALKLMGEDEQEFTAEGVKPNILVDGCKTRPSKGETIFEVRTKKLYSVPIVDFYPVDYGLPHQAFGFAVGPVCFK